MERTTMANRDGITYHKATGRYIGRRMVSNLDGTRTRVTVYGKNAQETKEKLNRKIAEALKENPLNKHDLTVEQYLQHWLPTAKKIRESTRNKYEGVINKHILPKMGQVKLCRLTTDKLQKMFDDITREGEAAGKPQITRTCQIIKAILSKALRNAERQNLVKPNLIANVELKEYIPKETTIWKPDEAIRFMELAKQDEYYFFFAMFITYGVRRGEALGLRWGDIDFKSKTIYIRQQYTSDGKGGWYICLPKTKKSIRSLPLLPEIEAILVNLLRKNPHQNPNAPILSKDNWYINPNSLEHHFRKLKRQSGVSNVKLHSLRHFVATGFKRAGISPKDAQAVLGHSTVAITENIYQHCDNNDQAEAMFQYRGYLEKSGISV